MMYEMNSTRSTIGSLEEDLSMAMQMESSTKFRADGLLSDISNEKRRYESEKKEMERLISEQQNKKTDLVKRLDSIHSEIESKEKELQDTWNCCPEYIRGNLDTMSPQSVLTLDAAPFSFKLKQ